MRIRILPVVLLLFVFNFGHTEGATPKAIKGTLDLRDLKGTERFVINLNGEWEFYWNKILRPLDFARNTTKPDYYGKVPSYWTDYPQDIIKTDKYGYATYKLLVLLPKGYRNLLAFDVPVFDSSYDIYLNGKYFEGNGLIGTNAGESRPEYRRNFFRFQPVSDTISIIINVANFSHRRGGFWLPLKMGTFSKVQTQMANEWATEWGTICFLMGFSLFFLFFFIIYPKEKVMGFFSMGTIGLALRPLFTSRFLVYNIFTVSWAWTIRLEYLTLYLTVAGWLWFLACLYPNRIFRTFSYVISVFLGIAALLTIFLPVRVFSYSTFVIYVVMLILMVYSISASTYGIIKREKFQIAYFVAFALFIFGGFHDIRVSLGRASEGSGYILTYIVLLFVFFQAALLLNKWVVSFVETDKLKGDLEFMNKNLEVLVDKRTQELKQQNAEIEQQNLKIALQNKQLSETIQLKNKIFSVVAHDLRSPVVNILYMLNLLKEKEYKEKYDTFANSSIQYAQLVISLLENMLVWGRGQEEKIKYSPEMRNLADVILTNLSIIKETSDKKEISINFTQVGSPMAFFDKDLLDIIIRNILSNAIKYTPRGGRISILLKDKSQDGGGTLLKICDNGIGISEARQEEIFSSSEISSSPGTENEKGTGFGLKLCAELIKINKGTISIDSHEGEGSCFSIILPSSQA
jgi:signal transduction histidine kinase